MALLTVFVVSAYPPLIHSKELSDSSKNVVKREFAETVYFPRSSSVIDPSFGGNLSRIENLTRFLNSADTLEALRLAIRGSASPEGRKSFNRRLSRRRAEALVSLIRSLNDSIEISEITIRAPEPVAGKTAEMLRYAEVTATFELRKPLQHDNILPVTEEDKRPVAPDSAVALQPVQQPPAADLSDIRDEAPATESGSCGGPAFFLTTNLLYDAALTPNIGIGVCFGGRFTIFADWMHAWWNNRENRRYWRIYGGDIEARLQLGHGRSANPLSGHRLGVYASLVTYDFQFGRSHTGVMGDKYNYAAGLSYGYSLPVGRRLNLDFSIGVGYAWGRYMKQHLIDDHDVWQSTHSKRWFGPTRAEIGLTWLIGKANVNSPRERKGGER